MPPAPPIIIRQIPPRPRTPPPLIIREKPPSPPQVIPRKVITITKWGAGGHAGPPPPRKVIVERLPQLPPKPRSVIIERWLPYEQQKRKVIYRKGVISSHDMICLSKKNYPQKKTFSNFSFHDLKSNEFSFKEFESEKS